MARFFRYLWKFVVGLFNLAVIALVLSAVEGDNRIILAAIGIVYGQLRLMGVGWARADRRARLGEVERHLEIMQALRGDYPDLAEEMRIARRETEKAEALSLVDILFLFVIHLALLFAVFTAL